MMDEINMSECSTQLVRCPIRLDEQTWPEGTEPVVSISCTVYNQKEFVEECIQGFLEQETSFPVEILIHDDASTDGTADILKRYESDYPSLIKVIYQSENQFSKGKMVNEFNFKVARGRFIALCHGDDYWLDRGKLEKQVAAMLKKSVSICGHPAKEVDVEGKDRKRLTGFQVSSLNQVEAIELISRNGNMLPFGSIMLTKAAVQDMLDNMPPVMFHTGIQMLGALRGGMAIMPDVMSAYRVSVPGSTTEIMLGNSHKIFITTLRRITSIKHLKRMYGQKYYAAFDKLLSKQALLYVPGRPFQAFKTLLAELVKNENALSILRILFFVFYYGVKLKALRIINGFSQKI